MWRTSSSWRAAAAPSIWKRNSAFPPTAWPPSTASRAWPSPSGIDALRDAGIPLVMRYKTTSKGTQLPDRWGLPDALRDDTGVIFASAFPGLRLLRRRDGALLRRPRPPRAVGHAGEPARPRSRANGHSVSGRRSTGASTSCAPPSRKIRMSSTGASCSESCRWDTRNLPNSSAPAAPTRKSTAACASTTQARGAGGGLDSRRALPPGDRHLRRRRHFRPSDRTGSAPAFWPAVPPPPTKSSKKPPFLSTAAGTA